VRRFRAAVAAVSSTTLMAAGAFAAVTVASTPAYAASALSSNWYASAPYDMPLDNNPPSLTTVHNEVPGGSSGAWNDNGAC
jgi:chitinase